MNIFIQTNKNKVIMNTNKIVISKIKIKHEQMKFVRKTKFKVKQMCFQRLVSRVYDFVIQ